ncbi:nitroreductase family protein [candidate division WOR-3 bacterium]|nr:nitroreductase family protein [candidate division WOR-3 bacterium]TET79281.1 MAG: nitroreductase family protein [Candidatus Cloacimonadota bacterium]
MELKEVIKNRRSIRKFKDTHIQKEKIEGLLNLAMWAPSGMNRQNWYFVVVEGKVKDKLIEVSKRAFKEFISESLKEVFKDRETVIKESEKFFYNLGNAPVVICVYRSRTIEGELTDIQSVAAAVENLLLLIHEEGLGGCWMTGPVHLENEINKILCVKGKKLQAIIPLGVPDIIPPTPKRKGGRIEWIGWD